MTARFQAPRFLARMLMILLLVAGFAAPAAGQSPTPVDANLKRALIEQAAAALRRQYIFPEVGERAADHIEARLVEGAYDALGDEWSFADAVTADLAEIAHDKHLRVFSPSPPPGDLTQGGPSPEPLRSLGGVTRADLLAGGVGYIEIIGFPSPDFFVVGLDRALAQLSDSRALIIDVRRNGGGSPDSVAYLVSHFLAPGEPVLINEFVRRIDGTTEFEISPSMSVATPRSFHGKPVYVLTSADTFSGGEEFAYDIQAFDLGVLVGETTGGGANPGGVRPLPGNYAIFVPDGRPINPVTRTNWEGVGVIPDIAVPPGEALKAALNELGQAVAATEIDSLSQASLFSPPTAPNPQSEGAIRRAVAGMAAGAPNYDRMGDRLAERIGGIEDYLQTTFTGLGPLRDLKFVEVDPMGLDVFEARFDKQLLTWMILVDTDGKVLVSDYIQRATEDARMAAFSAADADGDERLDKDGYRAVLEDLGFADQLDNLFAQRDVNQDGFVSAGEYASPIQ
jgi:hypothetical protein